MPNNELFFRKKKKNAKNHRSVGAPPPNTRWPPDSEAPPQTPSYCSHILLQL